MKLLDDYFKIQKELYDYFGYVENWRVIPVDDATEYYWTTDNHSFVNFAVTEEELFDGSGYHYSNEIYTQRFLSRWVYRAEDYTMICVDTHTDGNKFLQIFDNKKERKEKYANNEMSVV